MKPLDYDENQRYLLQQFQAGSPTPFNKGDMIIRSGERPRGIYIIEEGFVKVYSVTSRGEQYVHIIYGRGEIFPLSWIVDENQRNVNYEALTNVSLLCLTRDTIGEMIEQDIKFSNSILRQVTRQFVMYSDRIDNLEYKFASERLAYRLLFLAGRFGIKTEKGLELKVPVTHQLLASSVNLSRESVTRELEKLQKRGVVKTEGRQLILTNLEQLLKEVKDPISLDWWGLKRLS